MPSTLVGWHFTNEFNRHAQKVKDRARHQRGLQRVKSGLPYSKSAVGFGGVGGAGGFGGDDVRGLVREAVEEATRGLRDELRSLAGKLDRAIARD